MSLLTGMYGHVGRHIRHEEQKNRMRNTALEYDPKEENFLLYCLFYMNYLEDYIKTRWPLGISAEAVTEDKVWGF